MDPDQVNPNPAFYFQHSAFPFLIPSLLFLLHNGTCALSNIFCVFCVCVLCISCWCLQQSFIAGFVAYRHPLCNSIFFGGGLRYMLAIKRHIYPYLHICDHNSAIASILTLSKSQPLALLSQSKSFIRIWILASCSTARLETKLNTM